jgi:hypothetical protein
VTCGPHVNHKLNDTEAGARDAKTTCPAKTWELLAAAARQRGTDPARLALQIMENVLKYGSIDAPPRRCRTRLTPISTGTDIRCAGPRSALPRRLGLSGPVKLAQRRFLHSNHAARSNNMAIWR